MGFINTALFLTIMGLLMSTTANIVSREGKAFLDIFNVFRLNPIGRLAVGVQITFPISTFMPDLGILGRSMSDNLQQNTQNVWPYRTPPNTFSTCPSRGILIEDYLYLMRIDEEVCQERFICEMSKDPQKFMPLSEILLKKLSLNKKWMANSYSFDMINTTEYNLYKAAQFGIEINQDCEKRYSKCKTAATSMVNMELLWGWQVLANIFNIIFIGETQANVLNV